MSLRTSCMRLLRIGRFCGEGKYTLILQRKSMSSVDPPSYNLHSTSRKYADDKETASSTEAKKGMDFGANPFFDKYKAKILHMQNTNPEEYNERMKELAERLNPKQSTKSQPSAESAPQTGKEKAHTVVPPSEAARAGAGMTRSKGLDSVMKLDLIQDKSAEEITQLWNQYHSGKDCVFSVLKNEEFNNLMEKSKECPVFVYPLPRDDGFEFILAQFDRHDVYFTPLGMFQMVRENAPPCLTLTHYTELMEDKGIVLMSGQFDDKVLKTQLALSLVQQMSIFYGKNSKYYDLVHRFNYQPESFDYNELIEALKSLPQYDMK